ncbi:membrane magnesium transporter isoform X1 [Ricinus communis]|uniref:membrane magnesium transporter isoform X1 n=1 Tax=Ricinus communis TaxID=3988 RepID=UPI000772B1AE|nr:membrane magnesium transporter isoform X1 [Ricinus communis]|eukprot:XP_015574870.1 membrane magnesium transporter isoform X1 [Ricinus communis]
MGLGFIIGAFGTLILAHAAYSTIQYRGLLKIMEEEFAGPPMNVVIELLLGLVLCMWAALTAPGKFLSIHPHSEENSLFTRQYGLHDLQPSWQSSAFRSRDETETLKSSQSIWKDHLSGLNWEKQLFFCQFELGKSKFGGFGNPVTPCLIT